MATRTSGPATAWQVVRGEPCLVAWPHDANTRKCLQRTRYLRASSMSAPHEPAIARKYRLRTGMWRMQGRTHVEGVSIAGTAWGSTRRRGGRNSANKRREVSHQQTARARMGKAAPRKNSIRHLPRSYFISGIAGKASLNERKIGVAAKA